MNPRRTTPLLLAALLLGAGAFAAPAAAQSGPERRAPPRRAARDAEDAGPRLAQARRAKLLKRLELTDEQRARAKDLLRQHEQGLQAAREARGQAGASLRELREARRQDLVGILTPEQRARMESLRQEAHSKARAGAERRHAGRQPGRSDARDGRRGPPHKRHRAAPPQRGPRPGSARPERRRT
jgi:Spy/CpxP family protein refolding chaperone